ncbi:gastrula zinc finger protein XlCGF46.1-like [Phlebotomus papatasi]|uniref:gastrula zinc finger protein XlCGF46.1-like n=1 Tax=Phlebotomus papatasi TaxID=29031 RepID=UPI002483F90A|nr:gastrula zinc finger protein XlCGF46.1-like [Phlebotomus papatasi]
MSEMDCPNITDNCRACQDNTQEDSRVLLFESFKLSDIYQETTSLDIHENDGLPKVLCKICYDRLLEAYNFRKMCSAAVLYFEKILSMDIPEEKYTPPEDLTDPLMPTKPDPADDSDSSNSIPEKKYIPPEEFNLSEVPAQMVIDEKPLVADDPDDDNLLIPTKTSKKSKRRKKSGQPYKKKTPAATPLENTERPKKRQKVNHQCSICNVRYNRKDRLQMHITIQHEGVKAFKCEICGKAFGRSDALRSHMVTRHGAKRQFQCPEPGCKMQYETHQRLQKHIKSWHDPENPRKIKPPTNKVWVCEVCGKECTTAGSLKQHGYTHRPIKPFPCTQCPKRFTSKNFLRIHTMHHEGIRNYECTICGVKTITASALKAHVNTHTREKILSCDYCPYQNVNLGYMKKHMKVVHLGVRDFHCPHCERSFGKAETLKHHVMTHTGEKPHACNECGKRFIQPTALKTHMKTHLKSK